MLHGLQVKAFVSYLFYILACFITLFSKMFYEFNTPIFSSSVLWLKRVQTQLACLTCAEITTGSRRLPSFTVSWFLRSSKPLRSLSLSPTATSSPPLDQDSILFRHWKTHTLCLQQTSFFYYNWLNCTRFVFPIAPFLFLKRFYCTSDGIMQYCFILCDEECLASVFIKKHKNLFQSPICTLHFLT